MARCFAAAAVVVAADNMVAVVAVDKRAADKKIVDRTVDKRAVVDIVVVLAVDHEISQSSYQEHFDFRALHQFHLD